MLGKEKRNGFLLLFARLIVPLLRSLSEGTCARKRKKEWISFAFRSLNRTFADESIFYAISYEEDNQYDDSRPDGDGRAGTDRRYQHAPFGG